MARTKVGKRKITARFSRDQSGAWLVDFPSLPGAHTYGRSLQAARRRIPEVLELFDIDRADVDLVEDFVLGERATRAVNELERARRDLDRALDVNREALERTLTELGQQLKLSTRDAADLVGMSHQRVAQLLTREPRPRPARKSRQKAPARSSVK
ncbi:MAG TPA: hypothetical protein DEV93_14380 [Chloroflexi bacterium]|nr:hypothetical protein [Chloroflexota bacterium]